MGEWVFRVIATALASVLAAVIAAYLKGLLPWLGMMKVSDLTDLFFLPSLQVECSVIGQQVQVYGRDIEFVSSAITTVAVSADNVPVRDAKVRMRANVGSFKTTGANVVFGKTDPEGMFRAHWTAENFSWEVAFEVMASKDGFSSSGSKCSHWFNR